MERLLKQCAAELLGTFGWCFVAILAVKNNPDSLSIAVAQGAVLAVMVGLLGPISGGHFNPAVSCGLFCAGKLRWRETLAYAVAQFTGAILAGGLLLQLFRDTGKNLVAAGTPDFGPGVTSLQGLALEAVITFFLVTAYLGMIGTGRSSPLGGVIVGLVLTFGVLVAGPISGAAFNPARAFGPALASGQWSHQLVYWLGPLMGSGAAGLVAGRWLLKESK